MPFLLSGTLAFVVCLRFCLVRLGRRLRRKLDQAALATRYFSADGLWFAKRIPFFEIDDAEMQDVYYYRWKLYRAHIRELGAEGVMVTESLPNVSWGRQPFTDLNEVFLLSPEGRALAAQSGDHGKPGRSPLFWRRQRPALL